MTALKPLIEQRIASVVADLCAASSSNVTSYLPVAQRLKEVTTGYLLKSEDTGRGALVRVAMENAAKLVDEFGLGEEERKILEKGNVTVAGVTNRFATAQEAADAGALLEALIRLRLLSLSLTGIEADFTGIGKESATIWNYIDRSFPSPEIITGNQPSPVVASPVANGGNSSTGTISSQANGAYSGQSAATFTVQIVTGNTTPGNLTGLTFKWKKGSGAFSSPIAATGSYQTLSNNVQVRFALTTGQSFIANDSWTISASTSGTEYAQIFIQSWNVIIETTSY